MPTTTKKKKKELPKPKPARYSSTCVRCAERIDVGKMVEAIWVPSPEPWHRWVHQGCNWKSPYNSLDADGSPAINHAPPLFSNDDGIENSEPPPVGEAVEVTGENANGLKGAVAQATAQMIFEAAIQAQPKSAGDEYFDEQPKGGQLQVPVGGQGEVEIPEHTPELEDWVRFVVRDELGKILPTVLNPVFEEVGSRFDKMEGKLNKFCLDFIDWQNKIDKSILEKMDALDKKAGTIQVHKHEYTVTKLDGQKILFGDDKVVHEIFPKVLDLATCTPRQNIFLAGPSGCGKSFLAQQVAEAMDLKFGYMSCSGGINESHLTGRTIPNVQTGEAMFIPSQFVTCYEDGGLFLLDEIDAADPNVLIVLNNALTNGKLAIPNRVAKPYADQHKDFVCMVAANTFGRGSSRMYVGRNQLDEATLDRFRIGMLTMDYSRRIEELLCPDKALLEKLLRCRKRIEEAGMRRVLSTRFIGQAYSMMVQKGWTVQAIYEALTSGWTPDEKAKVSIT